jgi:hypothetical protein
VLPHAFLPKDLPLFGFSEYLLLLVGVIGRGLYLAKSLPAKASPNFLAEVRWTLYGSISAGCSLTLKASTQTTSEILMEAQNEPAGCRPRTKFRQSHFIFKD